MRIPRKHIEAKKNFVYGLHEIKYIHYRELYPQIGLLDKALNNN